MRTRGTTLVSLFAVASLLGACGEATDTAGAADEPTTDAAAPDEGAGDETTGDETTGDEGAGPAAGMCLEGTEDCVDTPGLDTSADAFDDDTAREGARELLGRSEDDISGLADVRIGVRDGESFALTEDYVLGRRTVTLATDADGVARVTEVTVELLAGPEVLTDA